MGSSFTALINSTAKRKTINLSPKDAAFSAWSPEVCCGLEHGPSVSVSFISPAFSNFVVEKQSLPFSFILFLQPKRTSAGRAESRDSVWTSSGLLRVLSGTNQGLDPALTEISWEDPCFGTEPHRNHPPYLGAPRSQAVPEMYDGWLESINSHWYKFYVNNCIN